MKGKAASKQSGASKRSSVDEGRVITDERFAAAQYDPRFQRFPRAKGKVQIDERFSGMFKDKAFQVKSAVDKRGRKVGKKKQKEDISKYYRLENEEEDWGKNGAEDSPAETPADLEKSSQALKLKGASANQAAKGGKQAEALDSKVKSWQPKADGPIKSRKDVGANERKRSTKGRIPEEEPSASEADSEAASSSGDGESEFEDEEERKAAERWARVRGLAGPDTSSDSGSSSDDDEDGSEEEGEQDVDLSEWGIGAMAGNPDEQVPEVEEETSRLAVLDLDWTKVRAVDILAMLKSFLGKGQAIKRVTVYPSDYGLERMADEARFGPAGLVDASKIADKLQQPPQTEAGEEPSRRRKAGSRTGEFSEAERAAILETLNEQDSDEESDAEDELGSSEGEEDELGSGMESDSADEEQQGRESAEDEDEQVNRRRLQLYERSRLRYYYAIVECADVATAGHIYRECDGMEFEHSASAFDLRFVPDTEDFSQRKVRDEATAVPVGYVAPEVGIAPMLHTKPKLTWDADDDDRKKALSRRLTKEQLRDDDFKAYLGSESEEDEEQLDEAARNKYSQLLTGATGAPDTRRGGGKDWGADSAEEEESGSEEEPANGTRDRDMELQVTFGGGLDQLSQRLKAKREEAINQKNDTVWQAYLRRRREKKLEAKRRGRKDDSDADSGSDGDHAEEDPFFKHDENAFDDPFFKDAEDGGEEGAEAEEKPEEDTRRAARKAKKLAAKEAAEAERQRRAELELLLMDDTLLKDASKLGVQSHVEEEEEGERPKGKLSRKARLAAKKAARLARKQAGSDDEDAAATDGGAFKLNVEDSRFGELFTSPEFALDPTDPRYKDSQSSQAIIKEATKRRDKGSAAAPKQSVKQVADLKQSTGLTEGSLKSLIASLKRKGDKQKKAAQPKVAKKQRAN